ncbi:MAG TPA: hypothetical protein VGR28_09310 [Candidatus Thermoplasmatota archaeon]|jgi:hypothetical protein|nr:hypothetical protein [Candidatus Thermoplasmatota archaeon]
MKHAGPRPFLACLAVALLLAALWGWGAFLSWFVAALGLVGLLAAPATRRAGSIGLAVLFALVVLALAASADDTLNFALGAWAAVFATAAVLLLGPFDASRRWARLGVGLVVVGVAIAAAAWAWQGANPGAAPVLGWQGTSAILMALTYGGLAVLLVALAKEVRRPSTSAPSRIAG